MASKFKRNGIWYIRFKDVDGKWKQKSCGAGVTANDADFIKDDKNKIAVNLRHKMPVYLIQGHLIEQLKSYRDVEMLRINDGRKKAKATIARYQACINNFLEFAEGLGWEKFEEVGPEQIKTFFEHLANIQSSKSYIMHRLELIKFFKWAISKNFFINNPMDGTKNPKVDKSEEPPFFYSDTQLAKIFDAAPDIYKNIFKFLYLTGLRIGELCNIQYERILERTDHETGVSHKDLYLPKNIDGCKTKRGRRVPLSDAALEIISEQIAASRKIKTSDSLKYIFVNMEGRQLDNANIYRNFKRTLKNSEVNVGHPHSLRHTFASHLAIKGTPLRIIMELMGHANIEETLIYAHLSPEATTAAANKLSLPVLNPTLNLRKFKTKLLATA